MHGSTVLPSRLSYLTSGMSSEVRSCLKGEIWPYACHTANILWLYRKSSLPNGLRCKEAKFLNTSIKIES